MIGCESILCEEGEGHRNAFQRLSDIHVAKLHDVFVPA